MGDCDEAGKRNKQERFLLYEKEGGIKDGNECRGPFHEKKERTFP